MEDLPKKIEELREELNSRSKKLSAVHDAKDSMQVMFLWSLVATVLLAVTGGVLAYKLANARHEAQLDRLQALKGECRDALAIVSDDVPVGLCPYPSQSIDTAWMNGNRALCRCPSSTPPKAEK